MSTRSLMTKVAPACRQRPRLCSASAYSIAIEVAFMSKLKDMRARREQRFGRFDCRTPPWRCERARVEDRVETREDHCK